MPNIDLIGVDKSYVAGQYAVRDLHLTIPDGGFMCLLGPSGCGKTTTLRMIAGLEQPTRGDIRVGPRLLDSVGQGVFVPPEKRGMGLVFQSYALWPHMTVTRNVEFGLMMRKTPTAQRAQRAAEAMEMLHIADYAARYPSQLSGGQQQRVALARMLAVDPEVMLLDEPLSNLDARLRLEMRAEIKRIHQRSHATVVLVTHDQLEAMTMATHVTVMNEGVVEQTGTPMEVYERPASVFVAQFVGSPPMNTMLLGPADAAGPGTTVADYVAARVGRPPTDGTGGVRPEALNIAYADADVPDGVWRATAVVETVLPTGSAWTVQLRCHGEPLYVQSYRKTETTPGAEVTLWAAAADLHVFDAGGRRMTGWDQFLREQQTGQRPAAGPAVASGSGR
ncbi:ABC transporter ATP-binding protein [Micromonospora peucetia]|uniref:ABC transporter ATP-binding protein n=1 Tax=Micromonospora peucetia TaxID=47871 RepID=A0A1C6VXC2_9ACTN|nr:ABC transporter ATP-binding protein [Micromonospora peucetia]WSA31350.1 ABC transporter ATP-binding protein [Micromonospora peucetia]SCL70540.1 carbohydrate ABC transporter ATP-binding protein, CUT1 family [Micromonospora peucetia]